MCNTDPTAHLVCCPGAPSELLKTWKRGKEQTVAADGTTDGRREAAAGSLLSNCRADSDFALTWSSWTRPRRGNIFTYPIGIKILLKWGKFFNELGALAGYGQIPLDRGCQHLQHSVWQTSLLLETALQIDVGSTACVWLDGVPASPWTLWSERLQWQCKVESTSHHYWQKTYPCSLHTFISLPLLLLVVLFTSHTKFHPARTKPWTVQGSSDVKQEPWEAVMVRKRRRIWTAMLRKYQKWSLHCWWGRRTF